MTKWEYYCTLVVSPGKDPESHEARLAQLGEDGWELSAAYWVDGKGMYRMWFRRPKQHNPSTPFRD